MFKEDLIVGEFYWLTIVRVYGFVVENERKDTPLWDWPNYWMEFNLNSISNYTLLIGLFRLIDAECENEEQLLSANAVNSTVLFINENF